MAATVMKVDTLGAERPKDTLQFSLTSRQCAMKRFDCHLGIVRVRVPWYTTAVLPRRGSLLKSRLIRSVRSTLPVSGYPTRELAQRTGQPSFVGLMSGNERSCSTGAGAGR
ncbi:hypothetical protein PISMIDRAFT_680772 [Pisolithus microcarpus 441]|uniref:Uncharacterized protein n=1 Tax=Pisolithus microcarpus 441 TaxID=765257 RepID=A0A0C9ZHQ9_9AGAM|nr:hypothetical protein PISMIDRAFT_680772 [Pisolithus microcarpus 441]